MEEEVICGVCDLCGDEADGNVTECNALSCTFAQCGLSTDKGILYHQACLDKFLRKEKLDKSRKTGFKCPRGCGKGSKFSSECPGRIDKSHPIFPRNETKKFKPVVVEPPPPPKPPPKKEKEKEPAPPAAAPTTNGHAKPTPAPAPAVKAPEPPIAPKAVAAAAPTPLNGSSVKTSQPAAPNPAALAKEQLMEAKLALRRDLGLERGSVQPKPSLNPTPSLTPTTTRSILQPTLSSTASPDSAPLQPGVHTLAAFMQMVPSKPTTTKPVTAAASLFTSSPTLSPSPSQQGLLLQSQQQFPPVQGSGLNPNPLPSSASVPAPSPWGASSSSAATPSLNSLASDPVPHTSPPPPPPRQPGAPPVLTTSAGPSYIPVGMEMEEEEEEVGNRSGLTRAQKKNLKRQEKKKKAAANANDPSSDARSSHSDYGSDEEGQEGQGSRRSAFEQPSLLSTLHKAGASSSGLNLGEIFIQTLVCRKALLATRDLRRLSFQDWQGAAAVQRFGSDTLSSIAWLLECEGLSPEQLSTAPPLPPSSNHYGRQESFSGAPVDISEELRQLSDVQVGLGLSPDQVQSAVIDSLGDVKAAVDVLLERHARHRPSSSLSLSQEPAATPFLGEWGEGGGGHRTSGTFTSAFYKQ